MPWQEKIQKQKETATKRSANGTTNIRAWFTISRPTQTLTETESSTEELLTPTEAENLNATETPLVFKISFSP